MRLVIDLQGAQSESRFRGIGRYSLSLAKALARQREKHEVIILLSYLFKDSIEQLREDFEGLIPRENMKVWYAEAPASYCANSSTRNYEIAKYLRESFIQSLKPDFVIISSFFEGFSTDVVTSIKFLDKKTPTATINYDILFLNQSFSENKKEYNFLLEKLKEMEKSDLILTISDFSKYQALEKITFDQKNLINISSGIDEFFQKIDVTPEQELNIRNKYNITKKFILYTGGTCERKNLKRLIEAFLRLPADVRDQHQLVFVGKIPKANIDVFHQLVRKFNIEDLFIYTGYVDEVELRILYSIAKLFVFPSLEEGFGLPPVEAIRCGTPAIASNTTSLPEVIGIKEALFDPLDVVAITEKMLKALEDEQFAKYIVENASEHIKRFCWDDSARKTWRALEEFINSTNHRITKSAFDHENAPDSLRQTRSDLIEGLKSVALSKLSDGALFRLAKAIDKNLRVFRKKRSLYFNFSFILNSESGISSSSYILEFYKRLESTFSELYELSAVFLSEEGSCFYIEKNRLANFGITSEKDSSEVVFNEGDVFLDFYDSSCDQEIPGCFKKDLKIFGVDFIALNPSILEEQPFSKLEEILAKNTNNDLSFLTC